ncbi:MAG: hypothetical protein KAR56_04420, partial [Thermoplasmata archaeon]|nr:hypothetical protein [Thermoplasmata archaeon]
ARGCQVIISGKLTGQRHRTEKFKEGHIKFCGEPKLQWMEEGYTPAKLKAGVIGVKVQIMHPKARLPDEVNILEDKPPEPKSASSKKLASEKNGAEGSDAKKEKTEQPPVGEPKADDKGEKKEVKAPKKEKKAASSKKNKKVKEKPSQKAGAKDVSKEEDSSEDVSTVKDTVEEVSTVKDAVEEKPIEKPKPAEEKSSQKSAELPKTITVTTSSENTVKEDTENGTA